MHGQCDDYLPSRRESPAFDRYQIYCLVTEAHVCEQLAQGCWLKSERPVIEPATFQPQVQRPNHYTTTPRLAYRRRVKVKCAARRPT